MHHKLCKSTYTGFPRNEMSEHPAGIHLIRDGEAQGASSLEVSLLQAELTARNRQETAIAELGQAALTGVDPLMLLGQACALIEHTLEISHCRAIELVPGGRMNVRAALGAN